MKLLYLGTPEFAVPSLRALASAGFEIQAVLCRADKPSGRGQEFHAPPVKLAAQELGLRVLQPKKLRDPALAGQLGELAPDVAVVVAYGMLIPKWLLELAPAGCVNVHGSLLPLLRGAAPIQHAILEGFTTSGITLMKLDEGMDTGPVYESYEVPVGPHETAGELHDRLSELSAKVLPAALARIVAGELRSSPQDDSRATLAPKIPIESERICWSDSAARVDRLIRALSPRPGAFTQLHGKRLKLLKCLPAPAGTAAASPGTLQTGGHALRVACGEGWLELSELQPEGKRRMSAAEFVSGYRVKDGEAFETPPVPGPEAAVC